MLQYELYVAVYCILLQKTPVILSFAGEAQRTSRRTMVFYNIQVWTEIKL